MKGKQSILIKSKQVLDDTVGDEGNHVRDYFNIPYEDEDENYNEIELVMGTPCYEPIAKIDDVIASLNKAKELGANFVSVWSHEDHQEIRIEAFIVEKLSDLEIENFNNQKEKERLEKEKKKEQKELEEFERLKLKYGN